LFENRELNSCSKTVRWIESLKNSRYRPMCMRKKNFEGGSIIHSMANVGRAKSESGNTKSESMSNMGEGFKVEEDDGDDRRVIPSEGVVRIGCLQKKSINTKGVSWDKRIVCLTEDELLFAKVDDPERMLVDWIALEDIVEVNRERGMLG